LAITNNDDDRTKETAAYAEKADQTPKPSSADLDNHKS